MRLSKILVVVLAIPAFALMTGNAAAQTDNAHHSWDLDDEAMDEIIVIYSRSGNPVDIETRYEMELRERVLEKYRKLAVLEERNEWRSFDLDINDASRIKWGYNAQDDWLTRGETDLIGLPIDQVKAATVFRVEF